MSHQYEKNIEKYAIEFEIPSWFLQTYTFSIYDKNLKTTWYAVNFSGKYSKCVFLKLETMMEAIHLHMRYDRNNKKECNDWCTFLKEKTYYTLY